MRKKKLKLYLTPAENSIVIQSLNRLRIRRLRKILPPLNRRMAHN